MTLDFSHLVGQQASARAMFAGFARAIEQQAAQQAAQRAKLAAGIAPLVEQQASARAMFAGFARAIEQLADVQELYVEADGQRSTTGEILHTSDRADQVSEVESSLPWPEAKAAFFTFVFLYAVEQYFRHKAVLDATLDVIGIANLVYMAWMITEKYYPTRRD